MFRFSTISLFAAILLIGCGERDAENSPLQIDREFVTVHEEGLGTIRFFEPRQVGEDLWAKCFSVPPTFLGGGIDSNGNVADPFADPVDDSRVMRIKHTAESVLEDAGITFGDDHYARFYPADSALVVVLPIEQMELVEAYLSVIGSGPPRPISLFAEVYEVGEEFHQQLQRTLSGEADHSPERDALFQAAKLNEVDLVEAIILSMHSGMRSKSEEKGRGAFLEADVVLSADGSTADIVIKYRENQSEEKANEEKELEVNSSLVLELGDFVVAGSWKTDKVDNPSYRYLVVKAEAPPES